MKKFGMLVCFICVIMFGWFVHRTEIDIGRVLNSNGDGKLYNGEAYYNYIYYDNRFSTNDIVLTMCLLNPLNNECDDILVRQDICLLRNIGQDYI